MKYIFDKELYYINMGLEKTYTWVEEADGCEVKSFKTIECSDGELAVGKVEIPKSDFAPLVAKEWCREVEE